MRRVITDYAVHAGVSQEARRLRKRVCGLIAELATKGSSSGRPVRRMKKVAELEAVLDSVQRKAADQKTALGNAHKKLASAFKRIEVFKVYAQRTGVTALHQKMYFKLKTFRLYSELRAEHARLSEQERQGSTQTVAGGSAAADEAVVF